MEKHQNGDLDVEHHAGLNGDLGSFGAMKFTWNDVSVTTKSRLGDAKPTSIIAGVDGVAKAGKLITSPTSIVETQNGNRRSYGYHGPVRQRVWPISNSACLEY